MYLNVVLIGSLWAASLLGAGQEKALLPSASGPEAQDTKPAPFEVAVGESLKLIIPRDEELIYQASLTVGFVDAAVGEVRQVCKVDPYRRSILLRSAAGPKKEQAKIEIEASGGYALYRLESKISARHLPQEWPSISYYYESTGTKRRRRQNRIGVRKGEPSSSSRRDTQTGAEEGARIWKKEKYRSIPENTIDMLSAVLLTRTLIQDDLEELRFPMVEKDRLWEVVLTRGEEKRMKIKAGTFDVIEVLLKPGPYPKENIETEKVEKFKGLFGIHGTIHLWCEKNSGVPVRIQGDIPAGPVTLGVDVTLKSFKGTPEGFKVIK
jgi:hypothetical protein